MQLRPIHQYHLAHNTSNTCTKIPLGFFSNSQVNFHLTHIMSPFFLKKRMKSKNHIIIVMHACIRDQKPFIEIEKGNNSAQSNSILSQKNPTCNVRSQ